MNTKSMFTRLLSLKCSSLSILALAGCLLPNVVHAGTCDSTIANLVSWLNQNPLNRVTATVASNRTPAFVSQAATKPTGSSEVTYSNVQLKLAGGVLIGAGGTLYYDDRVSGLYPNIYPFDPAHTDTFALVILSTGSVSVHPAGTIQSFAATCTPSGVFGVMYGQPGSQGILPPNLPFYTITFAKSVSEAPPN